jgi:DNA mismatch repair protein MutS
MAQIGSFIPAREGRVGLCDRIYCRVGASDNLARGESTFLVEMNETAYILNTASEKSLVIMDEVGRGTGTNDGLSIAWAVSEELLNRVRCRTFFATHYHELSLLQHPRIVNRSMEVLEKDGEIIFLRKLRESPAAESYGIHVARLAGLAPSVLDRAGQIMDRLRERDANLRESLPDTAVNQQSQEVNQKTPSVSATPAKDNAILRELKSINPDSLTPLEALKLLNKWKQRLTAEQGTIPAAPTASGPKSRGGKQPDTNFSLFE